VGAPLTRNWLPAGLVKSFPSPGCRHRWSSPGSRRMPLSAPSRPMMPARNFAPASTRLTMSTVPEAVLLARSRWSSVPSKLTAGRPFRAPSTCCGWRDAVPWVAWRLLGDWSSHWETLPPLVVTPASPRSHRSRPLRCVGAIGWASARGAAMSMAAASAAATRIRSPFLPPLMSLLLTNAPNSPNPPKAPRRPAGGRALNTTPRRIIHTLLCCLRGTERRYPTQNAPILAGRAANTTEKWGKDEIFGGEEAVLPA
jgi:hypothetical protein